jgi:hypothetical protein
MVSSPIEEIKEKLENISSSRKPGLTYELCARSIRRKTPLFLFPLPGKCGIVLAGAGKGETYSSLS